MYGNTTEIKFELSDVAVGGKDGEVLYVLDKYSGVTIFRITFDDGKYHR
jgi:hypothetical protein